MYTASTVDSKQIRQRLPLAKYLQVAAIGVIGLAISYGVMRLLDDSLAAKRQMEFDKAVSSVITRLEQGSHTYVNVLRNLDALYRNSVQVVRDVFELYSTVPAESNPAIRSIGYANLVSHRELGEFVFYARSERYYDYGIHPKGTRALYAPVLYVVPYPKRSTLSGFDLLSRPELAEAVTRAQQKRTAIASEVFPFRSDTASIFLMMATQHKQNQSDVLLTTAHSRFDGVLFVELDMHEFLRRSLGDSVASDRNIQFRVLDQGLDRSNNTVIATFAPPGATFSSRSDALTAEKLLTIADRTLKLEFQSAPAFTTGVENYFGVFALVGGIITTLILCGFLLSVLSGHQRALLLADRITEGNRRILETSRDIIGTITLDGRWQTVNPAVESVLGYAPDAVIGSLVTQYIATEQARIQFLSALAKTSSPEHQLEVPMRTADGSERWLSWKFSVVTAERIAYVVARDVTLELQAKAELELRARQVQLAEQMALEANASKSAFIRRLTRYVRSSLVTTLEGMHEMVLTMDATDDRQMRFVKLANESSDRLFAIVSDLLDVAHDELNSSNHTATLETILRQAQNRYRTNEGICSFIERSIEANALLAVEEHTTAESLAHLFTALSCGVKNGAIEITTIVNSQEQVLELQVLAPYAKQVADMIVHYNRNQRKLIEALADDRNDILFRLGLVTTQIRRVGGTVSVETLGEDGGNVALITLPLAS